MGKTEDVLNYDRRKKQLKAINDPITYENYKIVKAKLEVKLKILQEDTHKKIQNIELNQLKSKTTLCFVPKEKVEAERYELLKRRLKQIQALVRNCEY